MRIYNFSAGPAALPVPVLEQASKELVSYGSAGMSVMEMSHRSKSYEDIHNAALELLRELMNVPANYKIMMLQGGASQQFAMIPMNLAKNGKADFVVTGEWSNRAYKEASKVLSAKIAATSEAEKFGVIPEIKEISADADYLHICTNNTICGTRFTQIPDTGKVPLVADMSSGILSEVFDVSKFGLIYAGAQKNIGPAGVTVVIIREDLLENEKAAKLPAFLQYKTHADANSMYNTPPTYAIYMTKLCLEWLKSQGGVAGIQKINEAKAKILYDFLDSSSLFKGIAAPSHRSLMNIPFTTGDDEKDKQFTKEAATEGFANLGGHRLVGGLRASIYNAMPTEGVQALVDFMKKFEAK
ncbi:MAG: 3-phosphoserine/phosphohydroxythreonine transaminase [Defluviitaleaceae bacterium]|nr:3-phosphoserine/phosphohydroxythreonine transaminase [Defluviitaleaceae bacterium]MCL2263280.1 3-phosphoserine/phosphohydroxythreonine transaminase [Defluviitaleaceae bacterium]